MFSGNLRDNLDPFTEFSDEQLWMALEQCNLKKFVIQLPEKLQSAYVAIYIMVKTSLYHHLAGFSFMYTV